MLKKKLLTFYYLIIESKIRLLLYNIRIIDDHGSEITLKKWLQIQKPMFLIKYKKFKKITSQKKNKNVIPYKLKEKTVHLTIIMKNIQ